MSEDYVLPENWDEMNHLEKLREYADIIAEHSPSAGGALGPIGMYPNEQYNWEEWPAEPLEPYPHREELKPFFDRTMEDGDGELLNDLHFLGNTLQYGANGKAVTWPWNPSSTLINAYMDGKTNRNNIEECLSYFTSEIGVYSKHDTSQMNLIKKFMRKRNLPIAAGVPEHKVHEETLISMANDIKKGFPNSDKIIEMLKGKREWNVDNFEEIGYTPSTVD